MAILSHYWGNTQALLGTKVDPLGILFFVLYTHFLSKVAIVFEISGTKIFYTTKPQHAFLSAAG